MNLFENLQSFNESKTLIERKELSVSEYNKLKIALNKHNSMKANFILHPGKVETYDYDMRINVYGAFRSFEKTKSSYYVYPRTDVSNDQATRDGVGILLYAIKVNLIDESVTFNDFTHDFEIDRYLKRYEQKLVDDGSIKPGELDLVNLKTSIETVANASKDDVQQALLSKNFIYNLTGSRKIKPSYSQEYNLDLDVESAVLKEDFDTSMPNWLMRAIKMNNNKRNFGHKDLNYVMPLDTMKWTVEPFPEKGKISNIGDDEYIALLIDRSGDKHNGDYMVYFPSAFIGNEETIEINGRNRRIDSMSLKALAPYVKEFAHSVGNEKAIKDVRQKQQDRAIAQDGSVDRKTDEYDYWSRDKRDKSGYIVDPNKYKRLLAQNKQDKYVERLNDLFVVLSDVRTNLKDFMAGDDVIPTAGKRDYGRDRNFNKGSRAYKEYSSALDEYSRALEVLEKIKNGEKDYGAESYDSFRQSVNRAEVYIVNCLTILEKE